MEEKVPSVTCWRDLGDGAPLEVIAVRLLLPRQLERGGPRAGLGRLGRQLAGGRGVPRQRRDGPNRSHLIPLS